MQKQRRLQRRSVLTLVVYLICSAIFLLAHPAFADDDPSDNNDPVALPSLNIPSPTTPFATNAPTSAPASDTTSTSTITDPAISTPEPTAIASTTDDAVNATTTYTNLLPTVAFIPPPTPPLNSNATDPFFPVGSESCQKCKYFYPKLKQCNQIANSTLALLPRLPDNSSRSPSLNTTITGGGTAPAEFTTIMPFLQCICPNQGLAATKVCMVCFHITNQRNFFDQFELQNVSSSLSAWQEACMDSNDGTIVPPSANRGQSAGSSGIGLRQSSAGFLATSTMVLLSGWLSL
ncbi:hypothetical protein BC939DRAFT_453072 [Gamsiella multidivaricata]|uniref:uncharacterized protein n=1 Tax=Gamsiella multidivaricata TaxID=101098 RepID=UPI002220117B|nr:uncharacterized protein BC939DRAFT_453072 [Gamsiella multidivaricata]KAI7822942.1 hypothetical protein BC939DRAFT_453072 [Gamsiella multidivaricata]